MASPQESLGIVTFEPPFPLKIVTKLFHFDHSVPVSVNSERPTGPTNLPRRVLQRPQGPRSYGSRRALCMGFPSWFQQVCVVPGLWGTELTRQAQHRLEGTEAQPCWRAPAGTQPSLRAHAVHAPQSGRAERQGSEQHVSWLLQPGSGGLQFQSVSSKCFIPVST